MTHPALAAEQASAAICRIKLDAELHNLHYAMADYLSHGDCRFDELENILTDAAEAASYYSLARSRLEELQAEAA